LEPASIVGIIIVILAIGVIGAFLYLYLSPGPQGNYRSLMNSSGSSSTFGSGGMDRRSSGGSVQFSRADLDKMKKTKRKAKKVVYTLEQKFFMAGMFGQAERREFHRMRIIAPIITTPLMSYMMYTMLGLDWILVGVILGGLVGLQIPFSVLDRRIEARGEEIMYYLPLVIEQIAIGVSSSLDVGPCVQRVVAMADERDTHNAVTELIRIAQNHIQSGASFEDAITEVGILSGHTELKHTFMSLAQVARHGGEITRQLQELADAVQSQRETKIDAKIKKLELVATGPVAVVFAGFLIILLTGFGLQIMKAFD
jgi:pilus assembly protein TadC